MNKPKRLTIGRIPTGIPGFDEVLGGGLPEFSFNLVAGAPGSGKTTLVHQLMFANATRERPVLYFTVLGEPIVKMLRYQQQYEFFDPEKIDGAIRYHDLSAQALEGNLNGVMESIIREVEQTNPAIVVVDSFRTIVRAVAGDTLGSGVIDLQYFVQRLALFLTTWHATTFLVGEYEEREVRDNPVFTVADGLFWLYQMVESSSVVRKLQVMKLRGQAPMPGLHTFRITDNGLQVFPRAFGLIGKQETARTNKRISTGNADLDDMLGGGIPEGDSVLIAGPAGSGKTAICTQFIAEGVKTGEPGVIAIFEERPKEYVSRAKALGLDMGRMIDDDKLKVLYLRPLDLSVDETLRELHDAVAAVGAKRLVIDSLSGFELALATPFREDFRESLYRMVASLTGIGVTVMNTVEVTDSFTELRFSPHTISFLTDDIILQRYVEMDGELRTVIMVVKTRRGSRRKDIRLCQVTANGLEIGDKLSGYRGVITGTPVRTKIARAESGPSL